jgi:hypothetical protein
VVATNRICWWFKAETGWAGDEWAEEFWHERADFVVIKSSGAVVLEGWNAVEECCSSGEAEV